MSDSSPIRSPGLEDPAKIDQEWELDAAQAQQALRESLEIEARAADAASRHRPQETDSPYSPFARVAEELGYRGDPTLEPSPFFTTMHGYREKELSTHG